MSEDAHFEPINSIIGENATFHGDFEIEGPLRIDGRFSGTIISRSKVIVGAKGLVTTNIQARNVVIAGRVEGNIYAFGTVHLTDKAVVLGDIVSSNLLMDEGVIFEGRASIKKMDSIDNFYKSYR